MIGDDDLARGRERQLTCEYRVSVERATLRKAIRGPRSRGENVWVVNNTRLGTRLNGDRAVFLLAASPLLSVGAR